MMIARKKHKEHAKKVMHGNLPSMVGVNILSSALSGISSGVIIAGFGVVFVPMIAVAVGLMTTITQTVMRSGRGIQAFFSIFSSFQKAFAGDSPLMTFIMAILVIYAVFIALVAIAGLLAAGFVPGILEIGNTRYYLHLVKDHERPGISTAFDGYNDASGIVIMYAFRFLVLFLWLLPLNLINILIMRFMDGGTAKTVLLILIMLVNVVIYVIKSLQFSMMSYIKADQVKIDARVCMNKSKKLTAGHLPDLFFLALSFLGWMILNVLSGGLVGIFYYAPYSRLTYAYVYEELKKSNLEIAPMDKGSLPVEIPVITTEELEGRVSEILSKMKGGTTAQAQAQAGLTGLNGMYAGSQVELTADQTVVIGRDPNKCNIIINVGGEKVSGRHCSICFISRTGEYEVIDYSSNGTYVNGRRLPAGVPNSLPRGTVISLADERNSFRLI